MFRALFGIRLVWPGILSLNSKLSWPTGGHGGRACRGCGRPERVIAELEKSLGESRPDFDGLVVARGLLRRARSVCPRCARGVGSDSPRVGGAPHTGGPRAGTNFNEGRTAGRPWAEVLAASGQLHDRHWAGSHGCRQGPSASGPRVFLANDGGTRSPEFVHPGW